jgi:opacity protein-like surface antigen
VKRTLVAAGIVALLVTRASAADAQIIDSRGGGRAGTPGAWTSLFAGYMQHQRLCDPDSSSCWNFGSGLQWRGTLEFPVGNGVTLGVVGTRARLPLIHESALGNVDADANVNQVLGQLRIGGGSGIHQVIDVTAGMSMFSNFQRESDGEALGSGGTKKNWTFALAYGFALPFRPRAQLILLQEYGLVIGKRMAGQSSNTAQQQTTRLGLRLGLGG